MENKMNKRDKSLDGRIFDFINTFLLVLILLIIALPLVFIINASFSNSSKVLLGEVFLFPKGFQTLSYSRVLSDSSILSGYKNTIMYTLVGTCVNLVMTVLAAYPLSLKTFAARNVIMFLITFTMLFSGGLIPTYLVIRSLGLLDTFWVMVIPNAVGVTNIIIMRTFFGTTIPAELYDAAHIDGCSKVAALIKIVLPLSKAVLAVIGLFYALGHWNSYFNAIIYLSSDSKYPLQLILRRILILNRPSADMLASADSMSLAEQAEYAETIKYAAIIISSLPVLLIYPFIQKYFVQGVMIGAIKG